MSTSARIVGFVALVLGAQACAAPATIGSTSHWGFTIGVSNAPPPPRRVVVVERPGVIVVPGTSVYVVEDSPYDVFRYGGTYYCYSSGFWYRSRSVDGPFVVVDVRSVPRSVLGVPGKHWKNHPHGAPPGLAKKGRGRY